MGDGIVSEWTKINVDTRELHMYKIVFYANTQISFNEMQQQCMTNIHLHREVVRTLTEAKEFLWQ